MLVRLLFVCPLLAGILALGCAKTQEADRLRGAAAPGVGDDGSLPVAETAEDGALGEAASNPPAALPGEAPADRNPNDDASATGDNSFVAFRPESGEPTLASEEPPAAGDSETAPTGDSDIALLAEAIAELRASIEQLQKQNQQIMAALAISDQGAGPELADPSGTEPPEGSLAHTVLDLREAVEYLALEQEAMRKIVGQETTLLKPVAPIAPTHGTLVIENNTDSDQHVWVNGTAHWVWARTNATVSVPVGEVTTKLTGESAKTWEIKEPEYRERIEFVQQ